MKRILTSVLTGIVAAALGGCQKDEPGTTATGPGVPTGPGTIAVRMVDAPAAYDEVNIAVDSVRVHVDSADTVGGWYTISRQPAVYDLLKCSNGRDTLIAEGEVPAGYYSQMRLYIGSGSNIVKEGVTYPLEIPSGSQSGFKLNIMANIQAGVMYTLTIDFDAERSIVVTGNGRYKLKPVVKTVATAISGSLSGMVAPDTVHASVWAIAGVDTSTLYADTTGYFKFRYLTPATYMLKIMPADTTFRDTTLTGIVVAASQHKDVGTITLQKK